MIESLRITNFKAITELAVPLGPITVLIGPNDSGKSTILQALMALSRAADQNGSHVETILACPPMIAASSQSNSDLIEISADGSMPSGSQPAGYQYKIGISTINKIITKESLRSGREMLFEAGGQPSTQLSAIVRQSAKTELMTKVETFGRELQATLLRLEARAIARRSTLGTQLEPDGSGLVGIADELLTSGVDDDKIARVNEAIRKLSPHVKGFATRRHQNDNSSKELHFALRSGAVIPASQMSDGVVLAAAMILIALGTASRRLLIEEPENGLHPRQLRIVADTIRAIAAQGTQVVMTTHSPLLLNYFGAEETLLVTRDESGVSVRPISQSRGFEELASEMSLGELWYNVGDSALARPA